MLAILIADSLRFLDPKKFSLGILAALSVARSEVLKDSSFQRSVPDVAALSILHALCESLKLDIPGFLTPFSLPTSLDSVKSSIRNLISSFETESPFTALLTLYIRLLAHRLALHGVAEDLDRFAHELNEPFGPAKLSVQHMSRVLDPSYDFQGTLDLLDTSISVALSQFSVGASGLTGSFEAFASDAVSSAPYAELLLVQSLIQSAAVTGEIKKRGVDASLKNWSRILSVPSLVDDSVLFGSQKAEFSSSDPVSDWMKHTDEAAMLETENLKGPRAVNLAEKCLIFPDASLGERSFGMLMEGSNLMVSDGLAAAEWAIKHGSYGEAATVLRTVLSIGDIRDMDIFQTVRKYQTCVALSSLTALCRSSSSDSKTPFLATVHQELLLSSANVLGACPPRTLLMSVEVLGARLIVSWYELGSVGKSSSELRINVPVDFEEEFDNLKKFIGQTQDLQSLAQVSRPVSKLFAEVLSILQEIDLVKSASETSPVDVVMCLGKDLFDYPVELDFVSKPGVRIVRDISCDFFLSRISKYKAVPGFTAKQMPILKKAGTALVVDCENNELTQALNSLGLGNRVLGRVNATPVSSGDLTAAFWGCDLAGLLSIDSIPSIRAVVQAFGDKRVGTPHVAILPPSSIKDCTRGKHIDRWSVENSMYTLIVSISVVGYSAILFDTTCSTQSVSQDRTIAALKSAKESKPVSTDCGHTVVGAPWIIFEAEKGKK